MGKCKPVRADGLKTCSKCKDDKPVGLFYPHVSTWDRLQKTCIPCQGVQLQGYRDQRRAEGKLSYSQRSHLKLKLEVLRHYAAGDPACACCGEKAVEFLAIDHIDGGGRAHRKTLSTTLYQWLKREGFPTGFRVLCHNCNQARGALGYCPHQGRPEPYASLHAELNPVDRTDPDPVEKP